MIYYKNSSELYHSVYYKNSSELYHHGILGQKWGIRRYQNKDGSLTEAGKERYGQSENTEKKSEYKYGYDMSGLPKPKKTYTKDESLDMLRRATSEDPSDEDINLFIKLSHDISDNYLDFYYGEVKHPAFADPYQRYCDARETIKLEKDRIYDKFSSLPFEIRWKLYDKKVDSNSKIQSAQDDCDKAWDEIEAKALYALGLDINSETKELIDWVIDWL